MSGHRRRKRKKSIGNRPNGKKFFFSHLSTFVLTNSRMQREKKSGVVAMSLRVCVVCYVWYWKPQVEGGGRALQGNKTPEIAFPPSLFDKYLMTEEKEEKSCLLRLLSLSLCCSPKGNKSHYNFLCLACCQRKGGGGGQWLFCDFRKPFFPLISTSLCCSSSLYYIFFKGSFARKQSSDSGPENYSPRGQRGNFSPLPPPPLSLHANYGPFAREKFGKGGGGGDPH